MRGSLCRSLDGRWWCLGVADDMIVVAVVLRLPCVVRARMRCRRVGPDRSRAWLRCIVCATCRHRSYDPGGWCATKPRSSSTDGDEVAVGLLGLPGAAVNGCG